MLGCAALGAGMYGAWLAPEPVAASWALLIGGLALALGASWLGVGEPRAVRVGDLGILVGEPAEARRLHWYEVQSVTIAGDSLRVEGKEQTLSLPLAAHGQAAARIVAEASQRVGGRVDISPKAHDRLPPLADSDGERVPALGLQLAGRRCAASNAPITFENDARLCANCAALYHAAHAPAACVRCERPLRAEASVALAAG